MPIFLPSHYYICKKCLSDLENSVIYRLCNSGCWYIISFADIFNSIIFIAQYYSKMHKSYDKHCGPSRVKTKQPGFYVQYCLYVFISQCVGGSKKPPERYYSYHSVITIIPYRGEISLGEIFAVEAFQVYSR